MLRRRLTGCTLHRCGRAQLFCAGVIHHLQRPLQHRFTLTHVGGAEHGVSAQVYFNRAGAEHTGFGISSAPSVLITCGTYGGRHRVIEQVVPHKVLPVQGLPAFRPGAAHAGAPCRAFPPDYAGGRAARAGLPRSVLVFRLACLPYCLRGHRPCRSPHRAVGLCLRTTATENANAVVPCS